MFAFILENKRTPALRRPHRILGTTNGDNKTSRRSRRNTTKKLIDPLMGLFRGAVFRHAGGVLKQPMKQPTETPTSTLALMGRFPSLMGRFPTLMGRFADFVLRGRFTSWKSTGKQPIKKRGIKRFLRNHIGPCPKPRQTPQRNWHEKCACIRGRNFVPFSPCVLPWLNSDHVCNSYPCVTLLWSHERHVLKSRFLVCWYASLDGQQCHSFAAGIYHPIHSVALRIQWSLS